MTARIGRLGSCVAAVTALLAVTGAPGGGAVSARPDLVETAVATAPRVVQAGRSIRVTDAVRNRGGAGAAASTTGYFLSRARALRSAGLLLGGRSIRALAPRAISRGSRRVRIPASTTAGLYRVIACADERHRIRESDEANNCRAAAQAVKVISAGDHSPPVFAGLKSAVTCIPGPIGKTRMTSYHLRWDAAHDDVTPQTGIVYDVYQATTPRGENFSKATYTTSAGVTFFSTPPLPSNKTYYFVVRARDRAGNRDHNHIERQGINLCV